MRLSTLYTNLFDSIIRKRGEDYFVRGKIRFRKLEPRSVVALVYGSQSYTVTFYLSSSTLNAACDCPHYEAGNLCKHLWGVILALDSKKWLQPETESSPEFRASGVLNNNDTSSFDAEKGEEEHSHEAPKSLDRSSSRSSQQRKKPLNIAHGRNETLTVVVAPPSKQPWRDSIAAIHIMMSVANVPPSPLASSSPATITYVIDLANSSIKEQLCLSIAEQSYNKRGELGKPTPFRITHDTIALLPNPDDRQILLMLLGGQLQSASTHYWDHAERLWKLVPEQLPLLMPLISATGRCVARTKQGEVMEGITWHTDEPLEARLQLAATTDQYYTVAAHLFSSDGSMIPTQQVHLMIPGVAMMQSTLHPLRDNGMLPWVLYTHRVGEVRIPTTEVGQFLEDHYNSPTAVPIDLPPQLGITELSVPPTPILRLSSYNSYRGSTVQLQAELSFGYNTMEVKAKHPTSHLYNSIERQLIQRDRAAEQAATNLMFSIGFREREERYQKKIWTIAASKFPLIVRTLNQAGWTIEAEGKLYRSNGTINIAVQSGIDWFEVHGTATFGEASAGLPQILAALKRGSGMVLLDDGTYGLLPEQWLKKYGVLEQLGQPADGHFRFQRSQTGMLDALLLAQPEITFDKGFQQARQQLKRFQSIQPAQAPKTFVGTLRQYQKEGLGWMRFLQEFQLGGCLADDMGLGKTVQVLALLESRRLLRQKAEKAVTRKGENFPEPIPPSLVVVPKSLIFNWMKEAAQFTPHLRMLNNTGLTRRSTQLQAFHQYDVILTTYGTLRNDARILKDFCFDYLILDEAQAIKNASTESAKAVRLLQGKHRLAMSGTPIENHVGELWSLFEFLNPGMVGGASFFRAIGAEATPDNESQKMLAHALRPFILRRTKEQVATELPAKTEQTIYCELEPAQRKLYDELRAHYRDTLLGLVDDQGLNRSKMQILEALLRLRQLACHPGLVDKTKLKEGSAKLDLLIPQLVEVAEEGHKVLVFSQFTSFLAIVKQRLDAEGFNYEYLDGKTTNRQRVVERFQNDPNCKLFLISLKAGGLGLNLTAAEYVFLLDPWWNPAVEAQAIDRAHRIGQQQRVFAYRLIARDTVEEKVLKLQESKRQLADAIINADNALIRDLSKEDLELLLS